MADQSRPPESKTTAIATKPKEQELSPFQNFRRVIMQMQPQFQAALPRHISIERMTRLCLTSVQRTPKLLECTRESLLGGLMSCAQLGLEPDGLLGQAYLVPFRNNRQGITECQLIIGYKGLRKLAFQSGEVSSISARVVHSADKFSYDYGLQEHLHHIPSDDPDNGEVTHAYVIFRLKDGGHHLDVMPLHEIIKIRNASQGYKRNPDMSPWTGFFDEMAKKTIFRRGSKMAPASIEEHIRGAIDVEDRAEKQLPQFDADMFQLPEGEDPGSGFAAAEPESGEPGPMPGGDNPQPGRRMTLGKPKPSSETPKTSGGPGAGQQPLPTAAKTPAATPPAAEAGAGSPEDDEDARARAAAAPTAAELAEMEKSKK